MPVVLILSVLGLIQVSKKDYNLFYLFVLAILPPAAVYFLFIEPSASRYLFYAYPFLALLIPYAFKYLEEKFDAGFSDKYISAFIVSILLFSLGNPLNPELGSNSPQPDFESAYSMVESQSEDEEVLIAGRPLAANYYFRNPDYVLIETFYVNESTKNGSEHFSGSPTILNATNFNRILSNHDSGWVVATEAVQKGIDEDLLHEIEKLELKMEGRKIKVWRFEQ